MKQEELFLSSENQHTEAVSGAERVMTRTESANWDPQRSHQATPHQGGRRGKVIKKLWRILTSGSKIIHLLLIMFRGSVIFCFANLCYG